MGHSNGLIIAPVDIRRDVYPTLGISAYNGGYSTVYAIMNTHGKMNMWSLRKPVDSVSMFPVSGGVANWWLGTNKDCNLDFSFDTSGQCTGVAYRPPAYKDLAMFSGYNQNAICGLAFKVASVTHNLLSDSDLAIPIEDSADSVTIYDLKDCSEFSGMKPGLIIQRTGDNIPVYEVVTGSWSSRSVVFSVGKLTLDRLNVGTAIAQFVLLGSNNTPLRYPFPPSAKSRCSLNITADTGLWYSWSSPPKVYDPQKKGYYALSDYGRFSGNPLKIDSYGSVLGFVMNSVYVHADTTSPLTGPFTSSDIYVMFEWSDTGSAGTHYYRCAARLQKYDGSTFSEFTFNKGGGVTGNFGCDYRYLPKITKVCQFYIVYRRISGGTTKYYRMTDRYWINLNCTIGQGTIEQIG